MMDERLIVMAEYIRELEGQVEELKSNLYMVIQQRNSFYKKWKETQPKIYHDRSEESEYEEL